MNGTATIVSIIIVLGALVLAYRGLQSHNLPFERVVKMAGIWAAVIVGLVLVLSWMGA